MTDSAAGTKAEGRKRPRWAQPAALIRAPQEPALKQKPFMPLLNTYRKSTGAEPHAKNAAAAAETPTTTAKRKPRKKVDESSLTKDELDRRRVQRELRDLALKLRKEGKAYKPQKYKRKLFLTDGAGAARRERKKQKTDLKHKVRVVVLPIFWEQRTEEMEAVLGAAKKVEELLSTLGVRVVIDNNNNFKPGERMKHWETLGVTIRVEVGPQDVKKGTCVVAVAGEPGTVAKKTAVKMSGQLVMNVRKLLEAAGVLAVQPAPAAAVEGAAADGAAAAGEEGGSDGEGEEEGEEGDVEARSGGDAGTSEAAVGGDDMDSFALDVDVEEDNLTMSKKEIAKKKRKEDRTKKKEQQKAKKAAGKEAVEVPSWEDEEGKKAKKKTKLVVFK